MQRRKLLKLTVSSAVSLASAPVFSGCRQGQPTSWGNPVDPAVATPMSQNQTVAQGGTPSGVAQIVVDWTNQVAQSTPYTFGSNDYEITVPEKAADRVFQQRLADLNVRLIRVHFAGLSDRWADPAAKTWDAAKIKQGYDASYPQRPSIVQNIPRWPQWMTTNPDGTLAVDQHADYANFCADLVDILNRRQQRQIVYWEPLNENDVDYQKAGKLNELWDLYNQVAKTMKQRDPRIKLFGPALTWDEPTRMASFLQACKANVDGISWHRYASGDAKEPTESLMAKTSNYANQVKMFRQIAKDAIPNRPVPLFLSEYNINYSWQSGENRQNTHIGAIWFASVLKHLAESGIDMATSWHLKDGIYGMIDPENRLRPAANVFDWSLKHLVGRVMATQSDQAFVEAFAVWKSNQAQSLLLINKSSRPVSVQLVAKKGLPAPRQIAQSSLDQTGIQTTNLPLNAFDRPLQLPAYSLKLLRFST
jgi:hypothetical protein